MMTLMPHKVNKIVASGHFKPNRTSLNEVSGLDYFREANGHYSIYTASSDGTMRCFDSQTHQQKQIYDLQLDIEGNEMPKDKTK